MAALDCFLELDPVDLPDTSATGSMAAPATASTGDAAGTASVWAWKQQQLKLAAPGAGQQAAVISAAEEQAPSDCTISPGCSYSGAAADGAALLDLADDACSSSHALVQTGSPMLAATTSQPAQHQMAAVTFLEDLAAGGSVYQYCLRH